MLKQVGIKNIEAEILGEEKPVLVIYLGQHHEKKEQLQIIHDIGQKVPEHLLKLCLLEEESLQKQNVLLLTNLLLF